jgi:hypothetical protein
MVLLDLNIKLLNHLWFEYIVHELWKLDELYLLFELFYFDL